MASRRKTMARNRTDPFDLSLPVPVEGFEWRRLRGPAGKRRGPWLDGGGPTYPRDPRKYDRSKEDPSRAGLALRFARLAPTENAILAFAREHGSLGVEEEIPPAAREDSTRTSWGEPFQAWVSEIKRVRLALQVWNAIKRGDTGALQGRFTVREKSGTPRLEYADAEISVAVAPYLAVEDLSDPPVWVFLRAGNFEGVARCFLQGLVNERLVKHTGPTLRYVKGARRHELLITPHDLAGAVWLDLAKTVGGGKEYRRCAQAECGEWFEISLSLNGAKVSKQFHSNACRQKHYRQIARAKQAPKRAAKDTRRPAH